MREIKFRAWDIRHSCMETIHDLYWFEENGVHDGSGEGCNSNYILEQFTGLHDKNGKEIYEGDILHGREEGDGETTAWADVYFQIVYDEKLAGFMAHESKIKDSAWDEQICELNTEYEVIGNIHENPELLNA